MDKAQADRILRIVRRVAWVHHRVQTADADDLGQAILVLVWKLFGDRDPPALWVTRATHLQCLRLFRSETRRRRREAEFVRRQRLASGVDELSRAQRMDLKLAVENLVGQPLDLGSEISAVTLAELAATYGIPRGTLYRRAWDLRQSGLSPPHGHPRSRKPEA